MVKDVDSGVNFLDIKLDITGGGSFDVGVLDVADLFRSRAVVGDTLGVTDLFITRGALGDVGFFMKRGA